MSSDDKPTPVRVCASFHVRKPALPDFCEAAGRIAMQAGLDEQCHAFHVQREIGWTRQISTQAQSLFMLLQEWDSPEALEQHVRSPEALRFDRDLKEGEMLACAPMLSLFGPDLSVADLKTMAAEARASGSEIEEPRATAPEAEALPKSSPGKGYSRSPAKSEYRTRTKAMKARSNSRAGAWK